MNGSDPVWLAKKAKFLESSWAEGGGGGERRRGRRALRIKEEGQASSVREAEAGGPEEEEKEEDRITKKSDLKTSSSPSSPSASLPSPPTSDIPLAVEEDEESRSDDPAAVNRYRDSDELRYALFSPSFRAPSPSLPLPLLACSLGALVRAGYFHLQL